MFEGAENDGVVEDVTLKGPHYDWLYNILCTMVWRWLYIAYSFCKEPLM